MHRSDNVPNPREYVEFYHVVLLNNGLETGIDGSGGNCGIDALLLAVDHPQKGN